jgi:LysM repeat protein
MNGVLKKIYFRGSLWARYCILGVMSITLLSSCHTRKLAQRQYNPSAGSVIGNNALKTPPVVQKLSNAQYQSVVSEYIRRYSPIAKEEMAKFGVPASIILAQGIHESRAGQSTLTMMANNHFGVKCTSDWTGDNYHVNDDKPNECFRKYATSEESFSDHMAFLQRKRYSNLFSLGHQDYKAWAYGLKTDGYATNPLYAQILIGIIEKYNLDKFDGGDASNYDTLPQKVENGDTGYKYTYKNNSLKPIQNVKVISPVVDTPPMTTFPDSSTHNTDNNLITEKAIHNSDSTTTYKVKQGDTLYNISKRFNASVDEIRMLNNLPDNSVKIDQILKVNLH